MSRSTWYRRGKPMPPVNQVGQVQTQQTEYPLMLDTELSHATIIPLGKTKKPAEWMGEKGAVRMRFDRETSRYELLNAADEGDLLSA